MNQFPLYLHAGLQFKRTRRDIAQKAILANPLRQFFIVGSNVNYSHFHSGWRLALHAESLQELCARNAEPMEREILNKQYNAFKFYLEPELGRYPVYYLEVVNQYKP